MGVDDDDELELSGPSDRSWKGWLVWLGMIGVALLILWALGVRM